MSEEESQVVRQIIFELKQTSEQGIMYVIPLSVGQTSSVSIAKNHIEQSIPYDIVLAKKPSGSKRQLKRVKKQATDLEKRKKTLLTIDDSSD